PSISNELSRLPSVQRRRQPSLTGADLPGTCAEADGYVPLSNGTPFDGELVSILQPQPPGAAGQLERLAAVLVDLGKAGASFGLRPRHRTARNEIASLDVASIAGLVRKHLRKVQYRCRKFVYTMRAAGRPAARMPALCT